MDYEHQGWITNGAAADILEFLIPEASPESANELLNVSDDLDDDGGMVRWEFVALGSMLLDIDDLPIERLKVCSIACSGTLITSHHRLSHLPLSSILLPTARRRELPVRESAGEAILHDAVAEDRPAD